MATDAIALIEEVTNIKPHPNADKLEICEVGGYQCCIGIGTYKNGDKILYIPADMIISEKVAEKYNINTDFLGSNGRVKKIRLRGEPSFGYNH